MIASFKIVLSAAVLAVTIGPVTAHAESFSKLVSQDYATGKLTRGKSGSLGWIVSKGNSRFFCRMNVVLVYVGSTKMIAFTSSGRQLSVDRAVFEANAGGHDPTIPQWSDVKSGRVKPTHVGNCLPHR